MKDQPKHTPGPWKVTRNNTGVRSVDAPVCRLWMLRSGQGVANAHLIAAAPDLLEAARLQERHEWAKRNLESIGADPLNPERLALVMEVERTGHAASMAGKSAIAKAEGRGE